MKTMHRFFGIEFTGHRHDAALPYIQTTENIDINIPATGYELGCRSVLAQEKHALCAEDIFEELGLSHKRNNHPLIQAFETGVLLNDIRASNYIEDFIAGVEYARHVSVQLQQTNTLFRSAAYNALQYGIDAIDLLGLESELDFALGDAAINFKVLPTQPEPGHSKEPNKAITMTSKEMVINAPILTFDSQMFRTFVMQGENESYTIDMADLTGKLDQKALVRSFFTVLTNHIAACLENEMFEQYRREQVRAVRMSLGKEGGKIPNIYTGK